ncbi:amidase [Burkholderia sp. MSMB1078WGS]|uniref:amidase family protein n=1 Tax=Burkholderia sp. MSMB1078WGS TaxID=1637900 RepID=UPI00075AD55B|nr:amidase family protein [Burkholderia sp. MSMB1078WGS]KVT18639.1 amidase [Burkholderia sp. MSMB1078WGS]
MRSALALAAGVRTGRVSAESLVQRVLADIAASDSAINACALTFDARARRDARRIDRLVRDGRDPGPLAGVPFLVKWNIDVAGHTTVAGSPARAALPAAVADAPIVARLCAAGAVPIGATQMDELACGATGVNPHYGAVHLPADPTRMTGGSSSGSAASVAAGYVPLALGSDTNGSIRAPAALCGVWGFRPGDGRLSRAGCLPYADSLDTVGWFANDIDDLAVPYDTLCEAHVPCAQPARDPAAALRVAVLTGDFEMHADANARRAVRRAAACLRASDAVPVASDEVALVREAALVISNVELARAHRGLLDASTALVSERLRARLAAGLATSDATYRHALARRAAWRARIEALFAHYDVLLAAATPCAAPRFTDATVDVNGVALEPAKMLGLLTQPISFAGLPVVSAPCFASGELPVGVQLIGAPGGDAVCFDAARQLSAAWRDLLR